MQVVLFAVLALVAADGKAKEGKAKDWAAFAEARRGECVGPPGELAEPIAIKIGKHEYRLEGHRLVEETADKDSTLKVGVLSATKDDRPETLAAIRTMIARFEKAST